MNYLQEQFIGKTFNDKLNEEIADYLSERKFSVLGFLPRPGAIAMVHTLKDGEIKQLGGSDPFDIINDNFGKWLAAMHSPITTQVASPPLANIGPGQPPVDISGTPISNSYYYANSAFNWNGNIFGRSYIQIGSGVTLPLVSDFDIETPFANGGPEDTRVLVISPSGYNATAGRVASGTNIGPTQGPGTISEMCLFTNFRQGGVGNVGNVFLMSHDAINPTVPFVLGETIFAQYFFQI